jgi:hypothetical protein
VLLVSVAGWIVATLMLMNLHAVGPVFAAFAILAPRRPAT